MLRYCTPRRPRSSPLDPCGPQEKSTANLFPRYSAQPSDGSIRPLQLGSLQDALRICKQVCCIDPTYVKCTLTPLSVDGPIARNLSTLLEISLSMLIKFGAVIILSPIFTLPGIAAFFIGGWAGQVYIRAQLSVKREMSNARSPVLSHFGAAIAGIGAFPHRRW